VKLLLIQRARIAKKSSNKVPLVVDILETDMEDGQHWLIYCEDMEQLNETLHQLRTRGINANEYHSQMAGDRPGTLDWFKQFGGVLVSIRCLDEGVDIPQLSHAIILASSQNPRQFIQRRGRVLRKAPAKHLAVIHDAIVVPADLKDEPNQVALAKAELIRALEFADSSLNRFAAAEIRDIATRIGLGSDALSRTGFEEDDNGTDD
jgi:superfamily II DNA or RNA helicase